MKKYIFNTTQSDLICYNGLSAVILSELDEKEYDKEDVGQMYNIELENGEKLQAFDDELTEI